MKALKVIAIIIISMIIGFVNGLLGGAGGMFSIPLLLFLVKLNQKESHANAIFIILLTSIVSSVIYIIKGYYKINTGIFVGIGVILGGILGAYLLKKLSPKVIGFIFCVLMLVAGIRLVI